MEAVELTSKGAEKADNGNKEINEVVKRQASLLDKNLFLVMNI
jgi:hypothetical protein